MALSDFTFKMYTNSGLTTAFTGLYQLTHKTNLSDNPQDFLLYFGAYPVGLEVAGARKINAESNPGVDDILLTPTDILPAWAASTAYTVGKSVEPITENGYRYECTIAGTTGASEPTWPTSGIGSTVVSGTATFALRGASHQPTEIKIADTEIGLDTAVAGEALNIGPELLSGVVNAIPIYIRITNAVSVVGNTVGQPEIAIDVNEIGEYMV